MSRPSWLSPVGLWPTACGQGAVRGECAAEAVCLPVPRQQPHRYGICRAAQCAHERQRTYPWTTSPYHRCRRNGCYVARFLGCFEHICRQWSQRLMRFYLGVLGLSVAALGASFSSLIMFPVVGHTDLASWAAGLGNGLGSVCTPMLPSGSGGGWSKG